MDTTIKGELCVLDGKKVFIVDFDVMPALPIHGYINRGEQVWNQLLFSIMGPYTNGLFRASQRSPYAEALQNAIEDGAITHPGKYAIHLPSGTTASGRACYEIYNIIEPFDPTGLAAFHREIEKYRV